MKQFIAVIGAVLVGIGLFVGGFFTGQRNGQAMSPGGMMGAGNGQSGSAMMSGQNGADMMEAGPYGSDMMGAGMMGDQYGAGMMVSLGGLNNVDPLSIEAAEAAVTDYISSLDQDNLALGEIMIFANHAYAQVIDQTTATGAFEVLIDPVSRTVFPEPGPNMMWNTEYGMMSGGSSGMMGGMMNGQYGSGMMSGSQYGSAMMNEGQYGGMMGSLGYVPDAEISFTAADAVAAAQEYLDAYLPGKTADATADTFPGYYTLHVLEDGETVGMLSVNAYTGQVFLHHWHGDFIEMAGGGHE